MRALKFCIFLFFISFFVNVNAQSNDFCIVKTRPTRTFIWANPTLSVEIPFGKIFSFEIEGMFKNKTWYNDKGKDWLVGEYHNSKGFRFLIGGRYYFGKARKYFTDSNQKAPFNWFVTTQLSYSHSTVDNIEIKNINDDSYQKTINLSRDFTQLNFLIGRQFIILKEFSAEVYLGPSFQIFYKQKDKITNSTNNNEINDEFLKTKSPALVYPNISISIGYLL